MSNVPHPPKRRTMDNPENHADSASPEPEAKRRKLRKGTKSCWDCKKRKIKCTFDATSDTVCIACRRRGAPCIGQDQPEEEFQAQEVATNRDALLFRMHRVEGLLERLVAGGQHAEGVSHRQPVAAAGYFTPAFTPASGYTARDSSNTLPLSPELCIETSNHPVLMRSKCRQLSEELVKAFPSQEDINVFCKSDYIATFYCHQIFTHSGDRPEHEAYDFVNNLAKIPDPSTTPPILVAKRMIIFALFLQYFRTQHTHGLTEYPSTVMDRLVETAVRQVTTNETIVACIDGLECIILEGIFHFNGGNLRRTWLAFRRAIVIAQLMKIDHLNPPPAKSLEANAKLNPRFMWFRIVYMDSYLSLMLGLPHSGQDTNMEHELPGETPSCKLERAHTLIARRFIDRNRRDSFFSDFTVTQKLDRELLDASKCLPDKFWSPPNFATLQPNTRESFWELMRLCNQLNHYNLVHLLHLPYLLRPDKESNFHAYSKITCVNASREIIKRVVTFRNFTCNSPTIYCRSADFFALMAGMTILLTHIDSHRLEFGDWRAHQRLGDRALVEQLLECLDNVNRKTKDHLTSKSAEQLRRLFEIESDTARGITGPSAEHTVSSLEEHCGELQLSIPYFGIIKIGRGGITKDVAPMEQDSATMSHALQQGIPVPESVHVANYTFPTGGWNNTQQPICPSIPNTFTPVGDDTTEPSPSITQATQLLQIGLTNSENPQQIDAEQPVFYQETQYPSLAAGIDGWAFQGVDTAFFDSLMSGSGNWDGSVPGNM